ncbi:MAG: SRPBCC family protein [Nannocystaceae bacterium]|nr:SRPBCC family protein [Nannocystaceae bacterium]
MRTGGATALLVPHLAFLAAAVQSASVIVVEQSVNTSASAERMWEVLTEHECMPRWFPAIRKVTLDPPGQTERNGLGAVRHVKALGPLVVEEVVEWDAPHRYAYVLLRGAPIRDHRGEVSVLETPQGARATWSIRFRPMIPLSGLVLRPVMNRLARNLLRGAARFAESESSTA